MLLLVLFISRNSSGNAVKNSLDQPGAGSSATITARTSLPGRDAAAGPPDSTTRPCSLPPVAAHSEATKLAVDTRGVAGTAALATGASGTLCGGRT